MVNPSTRRHPASFRDPSGSLFQQEGQLYRQVNLSYQPDFDLLMSSGLYQRLVEKKLLIAHEDTSVAPLDPETAYKVIKPERIPFISYPYEWSFSQLKEAALRTLAIHRAALQAGMALKDASAYNIQFFNGAPILIDTLSFAAYHPGEPWVAYRQFCQHFLAPLALMSYTDIRLGELLKSHIDGIPLDLASRLLPRRTRFNFGLLAHIHVHAQAQRRYAGRASAGTDATVKTNVGAASSTEGQGQFSQNAMIGLIDSLEKAVRKLAWKPGGSAWADYYDVTNYTSEAFAAKQHIVAEWLHEISPHTVFDLGANTGIFSRLAASLPDSLVISTDLDPGAVEINTLECKRARTPNVLPLVIDLTNPSPAIGWRNQERHSFADRGQADVVMALALIHHLAITNNLPLADISSFLATLGQTLIIEFVPKEDSQAQKLLASRQDIFPQYSLDGFRQAFARDFHFLQQVSIPQTQRTLFWLERRP